MKAFQAWPKKSCKLLQITHQRFLIQILMPISFDPYLQTQSNLLLTDHMFTNDI